MLRAARNGFPLLFIILAYLFLLSAGTKLVYRLALLQALAGTPTYAVRTLDDVQVAPCGTDDRQLLRPAANGSSRRTEMINRKGQ